MPSRGAAPNDQRGRGCMTWFRTVHLSTSCHSYSTSSVLFCPVFLSPLSLQAGRPGEFKSTKTNSGDTKTKIVKGDPALPAVPPSVTLSRAQPYSFAMSLFPPSGLETTLDRQLADHQMIMINRAKAISSSASPAITPGIPAIHPEIVPVQAFRRILNY